MNDAYTKRLKSLLQGLRDGGVSVDQAMKELRHLPFEDLRHTKLDHHRTVRKGFPEVVYCPGKTDAQLADIARALKAKKQNFLFTRASRANFAAVSRIEKKAAYNESGRTIRVAYAKPEWRPREVLIISAGTSDIPVAEEAADTAESMGSRAKRLYDVGVAGVHRLLAHRDELGGAGVIVVAAGMEGALASVVGGLVDRPIIAVPTSVGYGASFNGLSALLGMLNTCAPGIAVVNIDNGFGAGYMAAMINREISG